MPSSSDQPVSPVFVVYDFACPYSYIAQHEVDRLHDEFEISPPRWRPYWLHPDLPEAGRTFADTMSAEKRATVTGWLSEMSPELGADLEFPDLQMYSLHAFAAMEFARDRGLDVELRRAAFRAVWVESRNIGDLAVIDDLLVEVGLDPEPFRDGYDSFRSRALAASKKVQQLGLTTTPTVLLGKKAIVGWHYYEVLERVLDDQNVPARAS
jgi:predicted DsbA family dithiol-disulfide isomerase